MRTLIVDDEALARGLVREYLQTHDDIEIVAECDNGFDAVKTITELRPDLIFLDIQMPRLSGLEVLELTQRDHGVIFTTAYDQHALKAFDLRAVDYLLKPFAQARFDEALVRARTLLGQASTGVRALAAQPVGKLERLLVRERNQVFVLALDTVACVEAQDDYIQIYCPGKTYLKTQSLSDLETRLDPALFVRVHRSWIINLAQLKNIERLAKDSFVAVLHTGQQVPISRAGHERIKALI
ncbi:MAG: response regulator [Burkholderiales bacterium]|nr:response regulator [Burkholderiales bacterium]